MKSLAAVAGICLATCAVAHAETTVLVIKRQPTVGYGEIHQKSAALSGQRIRIWFASDLNADCSVRATMQMQVVTQPQHGTAEVSEEPFFPIYPSGSPVAECNKQKVPGVQAFYTSTAGFTGHDKVTLQNATSEGRIRKIIVDIDVR
jgi:hypothetical protein